LHERGRSLGWRGPLQRVGWSALRREVRSTRQAPCKAPTRHRRRRALASVYATTAAASCSPSSSPRVDGMSPSTTAEGFGSRRGGAEGAARTPAEDPESKAPARRAMQAMPMRGCETTAGARWQERPTNSAHRTNWRPSASRTVRTFRRVPCPVADPASLVFPSTDRGVRSPRSLRLLHTSHPRLVTAYM
jgi:hypothetical protein